MSDEISRSLGRVEGKLDSLIETMKGRDDRADDLDRRVGKVENRLHWYSGAAAALGSLFGLYIGKH